MEKRLRSSISLMPQKENIKFMEFGGNVAFARIMPTKTETYY